MTSRSHRAGWLKSLFRKRDRSPPEEPMLLTQAVEPRFDESLVSRHVAKFQIGQVVRHRFFPFRGIIFDVDPQFANTEEWYQAIPEEVRPRKDQPFYHLFAENDRSHYIAYVSEQNLVPDESDIPLSHPEISDWFNITLSGGYSLKKHAAN